VVAAAASDRPPHPTAGEDASLSTATEVVAAVAAGNTAAAFLEGALHPSMGGDRADHQRGTIAGGVTPQVFK
jgi:hypothetical protein